MRFEIKGEGHPETVKWSIVVSAVTGNLLLGAEDLSGAEWTVAIIDSNTGKLCLPEWIGSSTGLNLDLAGRIRLER